MANILVISPTPSHPQDAGNRARIFSLLTSLKLAGHRIHFAFVAAESGDETAMAKAWDGYDFLPYRRPSDRWRKKILDKLARKVGRPEVIPYRPYQIDDWYTPELTPMLRIIRDRLRPEVVLVEYAFLSKAFTCFGPRVLKILDTHDVFANRHKLYTAHGHAPVFFYTTAQEEKRALDRADLILAIQEEEATYFRQLTRQQVISVGHLAHVSAPTEWNEENTNRLLFVGSANHINIDGLTWFVETIFPRLRQSLFGIELEVVGQSATKIAPRAGLNLLGRIAELAPHYQRATVVINPLRFGTGLKIKTIEALAYGKPLVTTSVGAAGLQNVKNDAFLVADTAEQFTNEIIRLLNCEELRKKIAARAQGYAQEYNEKAVAELLHIIDKKTCNH